MTLEIDAPAGLLSERPSPWTDVGVLLEAKPAVDARTPGVRWISARSQGAGDLINRFTAICFDVVDHSVTTRSSIVTEYCINYV